MLVFILSGKPTFEAVEFALLETPVDEGKLKHQRQSLILVTLALWRSFLLSLFSSKVSWKSRLVEASEMVRLTPPTYDRMAYSDKACRATHVSCKEMKYTLHFSA